MNDIDKMEKELSKAGIVIENKEGVLSRIKKSSLDELYWLRDVTLLQINIKDALAKNLESLKDDDPKFYQFEKHKATLNSKKFLPELTLAYVNKEIKQREQDLGIGGVAYS